MPKPVPRRVEEDLFLIRKKPEPVPFSKFIFNSAEGTFCGRTATSWAKISIFYTIFYSMLACLVAFCMFIFMKTIDPNQPKYLQGDSLIGSSPGLSLRPLSKPEVDAIKISTSKKERIYSEYTESLDEFFKTYNVNDTTDGDDDDDVDADDYIDCNYNTVRPMNKNCRVHLDKFGPCVKEHKYGYDKNEPCIFLKLNKIYGWEPEPFKDAEKLPSDMPHDLKDHIKSLIAADKDHKMLNTIWISCKGAKPKDDEKIGTLRYFPQQGFPSYYYPFENQKGYQSPLVAVQFIQPVFDEDIRIECRPWAENMKYDRSEKIGNLMFELHVDG